MQLCILLAVLATVLISESEPDTALQEPTAVLAGALLATASVVGLAYWGAATIARVIRAEPQQLSRWLTWFGRLQQVHQIYWLTIVIGVMYGLHWPQLVRHNWGLDQVFLLRDLLILLPVWGPLLCSWGAFFEVERAAHRCETDYSGVPNDTASVVKRRGPYVWLRARYYFGLSLLPVLTLLLIVDLIAFVRPAWRESEFEWLLYLVPIVAITITFPLLLSRVWSTTALPSGPLQMRLQTLTDRIGVQARSFRVWQTNEQVLNAAVAGLLPSLRYVFLTDGLLSVLRDDEVESVVSHEMGHVQRRHLWFRMLLLLLPIWVLGGAQTMAPAVSEECYRWLVGVCGSPLIVNALAIPALTLFYAVILLGRYSRLLEHDADLCVFEQGQAVVFCGALDRLSILSSDRRERASWLHPSTAARVELLQSALCDPLTAQHFRQRVDRLNRILLIGWLLPPALLCAERLCAQLT